MRGPSVKVVVGDAMASWVVVKLDEQKVKLAVLDDVLHLVIRIVQRAFGSGGNQELAVVWVELWCRHELAQTANHGDIAL